MIPLTNLKAIFLLHKLSTVLHYISKIFSVFPHFLSFLNVQFDFRVCVSGLFPGEAA